jgi:glycogen debranching enzyme
VEANFKLHGKAYLSTAKKIADNFKEDMTTRGLCSIAEIYDGDPPQHPEGAISQAWSVAAVLRILDFIDVYSNQ